MRLPKAPTGVEDMGNQVVGIATAQGIVVGNLKEKEVLPTLSSVDKDNLLSPIHMSYSRLIRHHNLTPQQSQQLREQEEREEKNNIDNLFWKYGLKLGLRQDPSDDKKVFKFPCEKCEKAIAQVHYDNLWTDTRRDKTRKFLLKHYTKHKWTKHLGGLK